MRDTGSAALHCTVGLIVAGAAVLAFDPVLWLAGTWVSPTYNSMGGFVFAVVCALFLWSASSPLTGAGGRRHRYAIGLLLASAGVRVASRVLAVNVLGALALVLDVYAIGLLSQLDRRARAVSPAWLAAVFALSLPLERVAQRLVGFPLQQASAAGACSLLRLGFDGVQCESARLFLNGTDVLVDLPCSGARGLTQLLFLFTCLAAVTRPSVSASAAGLVTVLGAGFASNAARIALLAVGIAYRERLGGLDVMSEPWHSLVGLVCVALAASCLVAWSRHGSVRPSASKAEPGPSASRRPSLAGGAAFLGVCAVIVLLPERPVDVGEPVPPPELPSHLEAHAATPLPLSRREQEYFTLFGGGAARARYGANTLMAVRTSSPLRHLHAPDECLTGSGLDVTFLGVERSQLPSATYRAVAPDGRAYRVAVTYVSDDGHTAASVAEVAWRWFHRPSTWTAVQRITPWNVASGAHQRFDAVVARALDLVINQKERP